MPAQGIGARKASAATPLSSRSEFASAHELFLATVQSFVPFAVMLARKRFPTHRAHERTLVSVCAEMGAQIVCPGKALRAQVALEGRRMLLHPVTSRGADGGRTTRIGEVKDVIPCRYG